MNRRRLSLLVAVVLLAPAVPVLAGVHYIADTVVTGANESTTRVESWVDGEKAKILFVQSDQPMVGENDYLITVDGGQTLFLVDPEEETYMEWDIQGMLAAVGSMMEGMKGMMSMEFSDPEVEKLAEEPGGEILGYPTTHVRYRTRYTTSIKVMGMKRQNTTETVQDLWATDAFGDPALGVWLRTEPPATGIEGLDEVIAAELDKIEGLPLKSVSVSTTTGQKGKRETTTRTETEVTMLDETDIPDSTFEIPSGYTRQQMTEQEEEESGNPFGKLLQGDG